MGQLQVILSQYTSRQPTGKTQLPWDISKWSCVMGRSRHYRSPWNIRRSHHRLVNHLHRMLELMRDMTVKNSLPGICFRSTDTIQVDTMEQNLKRDNQGIYKSNKTFKLQDQNDSFCTSTPKKLQMDCCECRKHLQGIQVESSVTKWPRTGRTEYLFFGT